MLLSNFVGVIIALTHGLFLLCLLETNQKAKVSFNISRKVSSKALELFTFLVGSPLFFAPFWFSRIINDRCPDFYNLWVGLTVNCIVFLGWFFLAFVPRMKRTDI